jgi:hypothetical protein
LAAIGLHRFGNHSRRRAGNFNVLGLIANLIVVQRDSASGGRRLQAPIGTKATLRSAPGWNR